VPELQKLEKFHAYLLVVLGIAFLGAGITAIGFGSASLAVIGVGAGTTIAAGLVSIFLAFLGSRQSKSEKNVQDEPTSTSTLSDNPDFDSQRSTRPPRTSQRPPIDNRW
jgi:hypothetical protein